MLLQQEEDRKNGEGADCSWSPVGMMLEPSVSAFPLFEQICNRVALA